MKKILLGLFLFLLFAIPSFSATAHVQTCTGNWATGTTLTAVCTVTAHNLLAASVHLWGTGGGSPDVSGVADITNGSYTSVDPCRSNTDGVYTGVEIFYLKDITGGVLTVTATLANANVDKARIVVEEISGADLTAPLNVHTCNTQISPSSPGTGTDAVTSTAVSTSAGDFIYVATVGYTNATITEGTGYTATDVSVQGFGVERIAAYAGGSKAGTFTTSSDGGFHTAIATFKVAGGGGGGTQRSFTMLGIGQ